MDKYQEMYIERKKQFEQSDTSPESVINLYNLKEKLEQIEEIKAKESLVNVYDLLNYKKSAYELLSKIGNLSDIKAFIKNEILCRKLEGLFCYT